LRAHAASAELDDVAAFAMVIDRTHGNFGHRKA